MVIYIQQSKGVDKYTSALCAGCCHIYIHTTVKGPSLLIHVVVIFVPGLDSRLWVISSAIPWFSHSLCSLLYLSCACVTTFIINHYTCCCSLRYLAQAERVAPPESLIRLPILVQVGRTDETTFSPAAEQNNLALSYSQEQTGTWGQGTGQQYWGWQWAMFIKWPAMA